MNSRLPEEYFLLVVAIKPLLKTNPDLRMEHSREDLDRAC